MTRGGRAWAEELCQNFYSKDGMGSSVHGTRQVSRVSCQRRTQTIRPAAAAPLAALLLSLSATQPNQTHLAAKADLPSAAFCLPNLTAQKCRGVFWETGRLYKKQTNIPPIKDQADLDEKRSALLGIRDSLARKDKYRDTAALASESRLELREIGTQLCGRLSAEPRYECGAYLNAALSVLDDVETVSLREASSNRLAPEGFRDSSLLYDRAVKELDTFLRFLPWDVSFYGVD